MKSKIGYSIAASALLLSLPPVAQADSLSLHFRDHNVGVGVNIGHPPVRYVAVAPPPVYAPRYSGYRQGWAAPVYVQPVGYWGHRDYYREAPRWERHRHNEWRGHDRREYRERGDDRRGYEGRRDDGNDRGRDWR